MAAWSDEFEAVLRDLLPRLEPNEALNGETNLLNYGLDSMGTVTLLVALEDALAVEFPDELLVPETFETADKLWKRTLPLLSQTQSD